MSENKQMTHKQAMELARELVSKMTIEEQAFQLTYRAPAIPRLNIPEYNWWNEALHGVARAGAATMFPQAIAMAASFDEEMMHEIGDVISTEGRAKYNAYSSEGDRDIYKGLTFWSPNINIFRDPRWGRGHETYGEDPYLTSRLGVAFIKGIQGDGKYLKAAACAKHFAVHSGPENIRHEFNSVVGKKDLEETYLPAFEACVKEGDVESVMGAYNRVNGEPSCGSHTLLKEILRDRWGFEGHVVSDCGAIMDFHQFHKITKTVTDSAALALSNGCDLNCGNVYLHILEALQEGKITEEQITTACERVMATRYRLGMFSDDCEYDQIPYSANDTKEHHELAIRAACKSMVLLKNNGILPLNAEKLSTLAVIGPNADSREVLWGNYHGTASRNITVLDGIQEAVGDKVRVYFSQGCPLYQDAAEGGLARKDDRIAEAVHIAKMSDAVILCLGLDGKFEGEDGDANNPYASGDKTSLTLPGRQMALLRAVLDTGKPVIMVLGTGSALSFEGEEERCAAVLNMWYPGALGGKAVAQVLFGEAMPSGKLPVTFYHTTEELPDFTDYSMKGRTYRYMEQEALYPFGYGLTYVPFEASDLSVKVEGDEADVTLTVKNLGDRTASQTVQVYVKDLESPFAVRNHSLKAFRCVEVKGGESRTVTLHLDRKAFEAINDEGEHILDSHKFRIYAGFSQPDARSVSLMGMAPLEEEITL